MESNTGNRPDRQKEQYGGKGQEQSDVNNKALRYQDRFRQDDAPRGHKGLGDQKGE